MIRSALAAIVIFVGVVSVRPTAAEAAGGRCPQYEHTLAAHGLPVQRFSRIMFRESRCHAGAVNRRSGARGLLQIMPMHTRHICAGLNIASASGNIACAARLYHRAGTRPWAL